MNSILFVDDDPSMRATLTKSLAEEAEKIDVARNAEEMLARLRSFSYSLVIIAIQSFGSTNGLKLLEELRQLRPLVITIVLIAEGNSDLSLEAMRKGAFDCITQPLKLQLIQEQVRKAKRYAQLQRENLQLKTQLAEAGVLTEVLGTSSLMRTLQARVRQISTTDETVMLIGESGSGKKSLARSIHELGPRSTGPFVEINFATLPAPLQGRELFGCEDEREPVSNGRKTDLISRASGGTLFLNELSEISPTCQAELLRTLATEKARPVGGGRSLEKDVRLITSSSREIENEVNSGRFSKDLYAYLNPICLQVPPLRERLSDIPVLTERFLECFCDLYQRERKAFSGDALKLLALNRWPGNVRQLRNLVERLVIQVHGRVIRKEDLPDEFTAPPALPRSPLTTPLNLSDAVAEVEQRTIYEALKTHHGHREKTAEALGVSVRTLHYKMNRYGLT